MRKYIPYEEPVRRPWTRDELRAAVRAVRAMATDEATGRDPRRLDRVKALAMKLGREGQAVRLRLNNIVHVLSDADLPVPACIPPLPGVGRRIATMILDVWHALDAEEDMAASGPVQARRPWTEAELQEALATCRRMSTQEARLGHALTPDEAGDAICETSARLGRRWSETRRVMTAVAGLADGLGPRCLQDIEPTDLDDAEKKALERLRRENGRKEG